MLTSETLSSENLDDLDAEMEHHLGQVGLSGTLFEHLAETIVSTSEMGMTGNVPETPMGEGTPTLDPEDWED